MTRLVLSLALVAVAAPVEAYMRGNELSHFLTDVSAWRGFIPVDPSEFPYYIPFRIYERELDENGQPVVAFEWLAGPLEPVVPADFSRRYTLGDKMITAANAGSLGIDWNTLETIFRQSSEYRFFDPAAAPGFLNLRDYFTGPFDVLSARFVPHELQGLFLDVHGEHRNDTNSTRWVFWFRADGEFLPIPEPATIALTLVAASVGCLTIRRRALDPHRRYRTACTGAVVSADE